MRKLRHPNGSCKAGRKSCYLAVPEVQAVDREPDYTAGIRRCVVATISELVEDLKLKAQTLRELEDQLSAKLQEAIREKKHPEGWVALDARIVRLRAECSRLRRRVMRRVETKSKRRAENKGSTHRHVAVPPPLPPLFQKQD